MQLWNQDVAAVLKCRHILFGLLQTNGETPQQFRHAQPRDVASSQLPAKPNATTTKRQRKRPFQAQLLRRPILPAGGQDATKMLEPSSIVTCHMS
ncbi:hypothetical protein EV182_007967, partial [Spiromyces aspiralis]